MRLLKRILPIILVLALTIGGAVNASAFTVITTHIIDNDDAQGYSNDRNGFDTTIRANSLYYGDARIQTCNTTGKRYYYNFTPYGRYTNIYGQISAYLNHSRFTDPYASYYINDYSTASSALAGYINQDLAAGGWNIIGTATTAIHHANGLYSTYRVELWPSGNYGSKSCGADAVKITLGY